MLLKRSILFEIDVQGAEGIVIEGARCMLQNIEKIFMDFRTAALKNPGTDPGMFYRELESLVFSPMLMDEECKILMPEFGVQVR